MTSNIQHYLFCEMNLEPAAIERLCQVVRVRGFQVTGMKAELSHETWSMALTVEGARPISMLKKQLEKLHTVKQVKIASEVQLSVEGFA